MMTILWYSSVQEMIQNLPGGWFSMSLVVVSIIIFCLALLYMVSKIFSIPTLDRKIREEFFQMGATLVIIAILLSLETTNGLFLSTNKSLEDMMSSMTGYYVLGKSGVGVNSFDVAYVYLVSSMDCIKKDFKNSADTVSEKETWLFFSAGGTVLTVGIPLPIKTILVGAGLWDDIIAEYVKAEENIWLALAGYFQINLLQWIEASMLAIYLPLGILLRSIPFTRGGGAAIMAIAITTYFFFPFFLAMFYFNGPQLPGTCSVEFEVETAPVPDDQKKCPLDPTAVESLIEGDSDNNVEAAPKIPVLDVSGMSRIKMYTFYYPFLSMLICIIIVRAISQILGGNISDIGRGMVRVI